MKVNMYKIKLISPLRSSPPEKLIACMKEILALSFKTCVNLIKVLTSLSLNFFHL